MSDQILKIIASFTTDTTQHNLLYNLTAATLHTVIYITNLKFIVLPYCDVINITLIIIAQM